MVKNIIKKIIPFIALLIAILSDYIIPDSSVQPAADKPYYLYFLFILTGVYAVFFILSFIIKKLDNAVTYKAPFYGGAVVLIAVINIITSKYALLPILAALPYAGTYYEDIKTGYLKNILLHTSRRGYYMAKSFVVFVMAAITVMIPLLLDLMAVMTIYPLRMPERLEFLSAGILDVNLFSGLYETNGALYALAFILLDGLFAGLLALVSVCVAERVESMFSAIVIPFAFYIMWSTVMMENNDGRFSVMEMLNPRQSVVFSRLQVVLMAVGGTLVIILWLFLKGRRKDVL